jgi:NADH dehydrogenase
VPHGARVEVVRGDLRHLETLRSLLAACNALVHIAPGFAVGPEGEEIIVEGTGSAIEVAREAGVRRLIAMSCLGAQASAPPVYQAKWKAEALVRASGIPFVILRPSLVLGRDDGVLRPLAGLVRSLPVVPIPGRGEHRLQPIDVEDLARCVLVALERDDLTGETVSAGGSVFVTFRQLVDLVSGSLGVIKPKLLVPVSLLPAVARALPKPARGLLLAPRVTQFTQGVVASPGIVERQFGFRPRPVLSRLGEYLA